MASNLSKEFISIDNLEYTTINMNSLMLKYNQISAQHAFRFSKFEANKFDVSGRQVTVSHILNRPLEKNAFLKVECSSPDYIEFPTQMKLFYRFCASGLVLELIN